jgi:hypothetical protein
MRAIYTLDMEELEDDPKFNPSGVGYRVTIYEHGEEIGDGVALTPRAAAIEALEQAGLIDGE